ncbi:hypothetical protein V1522DRAFT_460516 [Lipomyces starkeyi]
MPIVSGLNVSHWLCLNPKHFRETNTQFQWLLTFFYILLMLVWSDTWMIGPVLPNEIGLRCGIFLSGAPFATCFASALITSDHWLLANWRLLFLIEGLPSILLAFVAFKVKVLSTEEKDVAKARAIWQVGQECAAPVGSLKDVRAALIDTKNCLTAVRIQFDHLIFANTDNYRFSCNVSFSSLPVFLSTILTQMGFNSIHAQGLDAPPYFLSFHLCTASTWIADRISPRGLVIIVLSCIGGTGYLLLATCGSVVRDVGIALSQMVGQCGPIVGTRLYLATEKPRYVNGMASCAAFMFFSILALVLRTYLVWENKKASERESEVAAWVEDDGKQQTVAMEEEGVCRHIITEQFRSRRERQLAAYYWVVS